MTEISSTQQTLKEIIANELESNIDINDIDVTASLYEDGIGLDSISIVNFIVLIERKFNISFDDIDVNAKTFSSIEKLGDFIDEKLNNEGTLS
jgi:acyl carrier protein